MNFLTLAHHPEDKILDNDIRKKILGRNCEEKRKSMIVVLNLMADTGLRDQGNSPERPMKSGGKSIRLQKKPQGTLHLLQR